MSRRKTGRFKECTICQKEFWCVPHKERIKTCGDFECKKTQKSIAVTKRHKETNFSKISRLRWTGENNPRYNPYKEQHHIIRQFCYRSVRRVLTKIHVQKEDSTYKLLGYNYIQLKEHIEKQFKQGMSWENRNEWDIDHIIPIDFFLKSGVTDLSIINRLENLQPLWRKENQIKGNKITVKVALTIT